MAGQQGAMHTTFEWLVGFAALAAVHGCAGEVNDDDASSPSDFVAMPSSLCGADDTEPDSSADRPRPLSVGSTLTARACANAPDFFALDTSAGPGSLMGVGLRQLQGLGELEAKVTNLTLASHFPSQSPVGVEQRNISFVADGDSYVLMVNVISELPPEFAPGRAYEVSLRQLPRSTSDCCSIGEGPGCADDTLLTCLCQLDNACCRGPYDATCVAEARSSCSMSCGSPLPEHDCCTASGFGGCGAPDVEECVCAIDPYCCAGGFDENCVNLASFRCGAACSNSSEASP
jgi:hypothetical protein